ncbi:MAG: hypothetical protein ACLTDS_06410 [Bianqueaceae bacterium]
MMKTSYRRMTIDHCIRDRLPVVHRCVELRKKLLSLDALHCYDHAPLVAELNQHYPSIRRRSWWRPEAIGDEYGQILQTGLNSRWIDVCEQRKISGATPWDPDSSPYVLLNFTGTLDSVTLAHGWATAHSYYSNQHQPCQTAGYKLFVAEVASNQ